MNFCTFLRPKFTKSSKFRASKMAKRQLCRFSKIDLPNIKCEWQKKQKFPHCVHICTQCTVRYLYKMSINWFADQTPTMFLQQPLPCSTTRSPLLPDSRTNQMVLFKLSRIWGAFLVRVLWLKIIGDGMEDPYLNVIHVPIIPKWMVFVGYHLVILPRAVLEPVEECPRLPLQAR